METCGASASSLLLSLESSNFTDSRVSGAGAGVALVNSTGPVKVGASSRLPSSGCCSRRLTALRPCRTADQSQNMLRLCLAPRRQHACQRSGRARPAQTAPFGAALLLGHSLSHRLCSAGSRGALSRVPWRCSRTPPVATSPSTARSLPRGTSSWRPQAPFRWSRLIRHAWSWQAATSQVREHTAHASAGMVLMHGARGRDYSRVCRSRSASSCWPPSHLAPPRPTLCRQPRQCTDRQQHGCDRSSDPDTLHR